MGIESYNLSDNPSKIFSCLKNIFKKPLLLNINTNRYYWHAGAGIDNKSLKITHEKYIKKFNTSLVESLESKYSRKINKLWDRFQ